MNSVHEQRPNSDPKQCIVGKLGCVHSTHTQKPCRAHTARAVRRLWALLRAQPTGRTHDMRTASAGSSAQRAQVARIAPSSWAHVATSFPRPSLGQVATSFPGRDLLDD